MEKNKIWKGTETRGIRGGKGHADILNRGSCWEGDAKARRSFQAEKMLSVEVLRQESHVWILQRAGWSRRAVVGNGAGEFMEWPERIGPYRSSLQVIVRTGGLLIWANWGAPGGCWEEVRCDLPGLKSITLTAMLKIDFRRAREEVGRPGSRLLNNSGRKWQWLDLAAMEVVFLK